MVKRTAVILFVLLLWGVVPVTAGVVAETDRSGAYVRTLVFARSSIKNPKIWNVKRARTGFIALNAGGDTVGDMYPQILEDASAGLRPWVVWSRYNGSDYDLAWARWVDDRTQWSSVSMLETSPALGDDLDPSLTFDLDERPNLAWWSDDLGTGKIYFSMYVGDTWSGRFLVSDASVDSRYPTITVNPEGSIDVEYLTPQGIETRTLFISKGVSINEDSDPIFSISFTEISSNP